MPTTVHEILFVYIWILRIGVGSAVTVVECVRLCVLSLMLTILYISMLIRTWAHIQTTLITECMCSVSASRCPHEPERTPSNGEHVYETERTPYSVIISRICTQERTPQTGEHMLGCIDLLMYVHRGIPIEYVPIYKYINTHIYTYVCVICINPSPLYSPERTPSNGEHILHPRGHPTRRTYVAYAPKRGHPQLVNIWWGVVTTIYKINIYTSIYPGLCVDI